METFEKYKKNVLPCHGITVKQNVLGAGDLRGDVGGGVWGLVWGFLHSPNILFTVYLLYNSF